MKIGFIGIGVMGESMARHLMEKGHSLTVYNRTKSRADRLLAEGAVWAESAGACAKDQDAVITIVGFPKDVEEVYLAAGGILDSARPGAYLIDMTTTSPALMAAASPLRRSSGASGRWTAPVSGGDSGARNATLSIMVGGDEADFEACRPLFEAMGKSIMLTGGPGCGQHTKMANQIAIAGCVAGVAEAIRYGEAGGLDVSNMLDCISAGAAGSWQMSNNGPKMVKEDWAPGFYIKHFIKDMRIAVEEADQRGAELPVLKQVLNIYEHLQEQGQGDLGTQAIIKAYR